MIIAISEGAWATIGLSITQVGALVALLIQNRRNSRKLNDVSRAVNHVGPGEPTLVQRVARLERRSDHQTRWLTDVLTLLAAQLGVKLPPHPSDEEAA